MTESTLISELEKLLSGRIKKKKISNGNMNYYLSGGQFGPTYVTKCYLCISIDSASIAERMTYFITLLFIPVKEI